MITAGSKGSNLHVIGVIRILDLVHTEIRRSSFKKDQAKIRVSDCLRKTRSLHDEFVVPLSHSGIEQGSSDPKILRLGALQPDAKTNRISMVKNQSCC